MKPFEIPAERLATVLHYVIARTAPLDFGLTKLFKVVWFADVEYYRRHNKTITGADSFQKMQHGPVPNGFRKALRSLHNAGSIVQDKVPTSVGVRDQYYSLAEPDFSVFGAEEISVLHLCIDRLRSVSAEEASRMTHDALWDEIDLLEQIPIKAAAARPTEPDQEILAWALGESS